VFSVANHGKSGHKLTRPHGFARAQCQRQDGNDRISAEYRPNKPRLSGGDRALVNLYRLGRALDSAATILFPPNAAADH
jgi:hypothetical protein